MPGRPPLAAVLLAAGRAERYGGGKLGESLGAGVTVVARTLLGLLALDAATLDGVWLTGREPELRRWLGPLGDDPRVHFVSVPAGLGQGDSLAAAARALPPGMDVVVVLGDQPFAAPAAVSAVLARRDEAAAVAAMADGRRLPPAFFAAALRGALEGLGGDRGARDLLARLDAPAVTLDDGDWSLDLDRREDLTALRLAAARDPILASVEVGR